MSAPVALSVIFLDGRPGILYEQERGEARKGTDFTYSERLMLTPDEAIGFGQALINAGEAGICMIGEPAAAPREEPSTGAARAASADLAVPPAGSATGSARKAGVPAHFQKPWEGL